MSKEEFEIPIDVEQTPAEIEEGLRNSGFLSGDEQSPEVLRAEKETHIRKLNAVAEKIIADLEPIKDSIGMREIDIIEANIKSEQGDLTKIFCRVRLTDTNGKYINVDIRMNENGKILVPDIPAELRGKAEDTIAASFDAIINEQTYL